MSLHKRRSLIGLDDALSLKSHCCLLGISRSSLYYEPVTTSSLNLWIMELIDKQHTADRVRYGQLKTKRYSESILGILISRNRIRRLMHLLSIEGGYKKKRTTTPYKDHKIYP